MAALAAGALMLALVGGTASAANAGGPLYAARIWIEMANLPAGALARAEAEIARLNARLQEARQAYARGDGPAAEAALTAYSVILTEAVAGSAGDPAATAAIEIQPDAARRGPGAHGRQRAAHGSGGGPTCIGVQHSGPERPG